ncbi:hypothetical protein K449DRAFT_429279 [Hypoxylon sp. EC38]|nr:hypothetical protein K449DRAFT_429279 [Hypoxylon sp. EC38]
MPDSSSQSQGQQRSASTKRVPKSESYALPNGKERSTYPHAMTNPSGYQDRPFVYTGGDSSNMNSNMNKSNTTSTLRDIEEAQKYLSLMDPGQKMNHIKVIEEALVSFKKTAAGTWDEKECMIVEDQIAKLEELLDAAKSSPKGYDLYLAGLLVYSPPIGWQLKEDGLIYFDGVTGYFDEKESIMNKNSERIRTASIINLMIVAYMAIMTFMAVMTDGPAMRRGSK